MVMSLWPPFFGTPCICKPMSSVPRPAETVIPTGLSAEMLLMQTKSISYALAPSAMVDGGPPRNTAID